MATYVKISRDDFDSFMTKLGFICLNSEQANKEFIYANTWHGGEYMLKIYSSITDRDDARDVGKDAIRFVLHTKLEGMYVPVTKGRRVHRVSGWRANLMQRVREMESIGLKREENWQCKNCGGHLILREGKYGNFYGCENYPEKRGGCRFTRNAA